MQPQRSAKAPALRLRLRFSRDERGVAAIEFAAVAMILVTILVNAVDFGIYEFRTMQVQEAAQVGAQAAWSIINTPGSACNSVAMLPATNNCPGLNAAVTTAVQSTSLGRRATLATGSPSESYYCVNASGALQSVGSLSSKPSDCSAAGNANALDSGAKRNEVKRSGFAHPFQVRQARLGKAS